MKWTDKAPTKAGFYWAKQWPNRPQVVEVMDSLTVWITGHNIPVDINEFFIWSEFSIEQPYESNNR